MDDAEKRKKVESAQLLILSKYPFYGHLLCNIDLREIKTEEEWGTQRGMTHGLRSSEDTIEYYLPECPEGVGEIMFGLMHEISHIAFRHCSRCETRDPMIWNLSTDALINTLLEAYTGSSVMKIVPNVIFPEVLPWKKGQEVTKATISSLTEEEVYDRLRITKVNICAMIGCNEKKEHEHSCHAKPQPGKNKGKDSDKDGKSTNGTATEAEKQLKWKRAVAAAAQAARQRGTLPAGMDALVDRLLNPKKDWKTILSDFWVFANQTYQYLPPDRRNSFSDFLFPDYTISHQLSDLVIAVDTSGSISNEELQQIISESMSIVSISKRTWIIFCDAAVHGVHELTEDETVPPKPKGRGGTAFTPVFKYVEKMKEEGEWNPAALLYFTDGYGDWDSLRTFSPSYPVLWVVHTEMDDIPFGRRVQYP
jgi:predicted metal-dependent peptidase